MYIVIIALIVILAILARALLSGQSGDRISYFDSDPDIFDRFNRIGKRTRNALGNGMYLRPGY